MRLSLLKPFSGMAWHGINKSIEGESHLSCSIMQMTGQIASTAVTPVNSSRKGKAVMQGVRRGPQGLPGCGSVKQEESWIHYRGAIKSKVIHFNSLLEEEREMNLFFGTEGGVSWEEPASFGEKEGANVIFQRKEGYHFLNPRSWPAGHHYLKEQDSRSSDLVFCSPLPSCQGSVGKASRGTRKMKYSMYHEDIRKTEWSQIRKTVLGNSAVPFHIKNC